MSAETVQVVYSRRVLVVVAPEAVELVATLEGQTFHKMEETIAVTLK